MFRSRRGLTCRTGRPGCRLGGGAQQPPFAQPTPRGGQTQRHGVGREAAGGPARISDLAGEHCEPTTFPVQDTEHTQLGRRGIARLPPHQQAGVQPRPGHAAADAQGGEEHPRGQRAVQARRCTFKDKGWGTDSYLDNQRRAELLFPTDPDELSGERQDRRRRLSPGRVYEGKAYQAVPPRGESTTSAASSGTRTRSSMPACGRRHLRSRVAGSRPGDPACTRKCSSTRRTRPGKRRRRSAFRNCAARAREPNRLRSPRRSTSKPQAADRNTPFGHRGHRRRPIRAFAPL